MEISSTFKCPCRPEFTRPKNVHLDLEAYKRRCCLCGTESEEQKGFHCPHL